jgi:hypothetical protein
MGGGACNFLRARARQDGGWDGLLFGPPLKSGKTTFALYAYLTTDPREK